MKQENTLKESPFLRNFSEGLLKSLKKQTFNEYLRDKFLTEWLLYDVRIHKLMNFVLLFSLEIMFKDLRIMFYFQLFSIIFCFFFINHFSIIVI